MNRRGFLLGGAAGALAGAAPAAAKAVRVLVNMPPSGVMGARPDRVLIDDPWAWRPEHPNCRCVLDADPYAALRRYDLAEKIDIDAILAPLRRPLLRPLLDELKPRFIERVASALREAAKETAT